MVFRSRHICYVVAVFVTMFLAGCGGGSTTSLVSPPPTTFQLTVTGPAAATGTVTSSPAGINCPSTCTATFAQNTQVTLTETPAASYIFAGWSGACSGTTTCTIGISAASSVTATFTQSAMPQLSVTVSGAGTVTSSPAGISCPSTCLAIFAQNTQVTLTETPAAGSIFSGWGGACSGTGACTITLSAAAAVTASFASAPTQLTVTLLGSGTVTSNPAGINCPSTCTATFAQNTMVTLTAASAAGYTFTGWSGACSGSSACTITISTATAVTATFTQVTPQLTVAVSGTGTVTSSPAGINCPTTCSATFAQNASVTLTETPGSGFTFAGWGGACANSATSCTVMIAGVTTVTAAFSQVSTAQLTVAVSGLGNVTSSPAGIACPGTCSANFAQNSMVSLTASPGSGDALGSWAGSCSGKTNPCAFTITGASSVTATFTPLGTITVSLIGAGSGTVVSSPAGINCPGTCSASFANNTQVTLTESADSKSSFAAWTGACAANTTCSVLVTNSTSDAVTAAFGLTLQSAINHIIFLAQENRSLDHYFGAMRQYWAANGYPDQKFDGLPQFNPVSGILPLQGPAATNPGCNPADPFTSPANTSLDCMWDPTHPVTSFHLQTMCVENPSPSWNESHVDWNFNDPTDATMNPTLDGFVWTTAHDSRAPVGNGTLPQFMDVNGTRVMGYYDGNDLNYYYFMASNFATSDQWFSPVMSRTNPNREYLIAGTSYGFAYPNGTNPADNLQIPSPVIFEELQNAGITWKLYVYPDPNANTYGTLSCAANDTRPVCLYQISYLHNFTYGQTIINQFPQNIVPISQFYTDAAAGTLPQVAEIEPASVKGLDEHAADFDPTPQNPTACCSVQAGAAYVKSLIDAVMGTPGHPSPSWKDSVFILTYDEFGGFYDHVAPQPMPIPDSASSLPSPVDLFQGPPPANTPGPDVCVKVGGPTCQFQFTGYRVPLIVVSPFTKQNYVSHAPADYTAILKLIEDRFNLNPLTARDSFQLHMGVEFLDLVKEPWKTPPTPPAQNTSGQCYLDHLP